MVASLITYLHEYTYVLHDDRNMPSDAKSSTSLSRHKLAFSDFDVHLAAIMLV